MSIDESHWIALGRPPPLGDSSHSTNEIHRFFRLYRERITQIEAKLSEVRSGKSVEYLQPLEELQVNMKNRMEVGTVLRGLRLENIRCKYDAEIIANEQNFQVRVLFNGRAFPFIYRAQ